MRDMERAKKLLAEGGYTCALCGGEFTYTSRERGVKPLLALLDGEGAPRGFAAADRVVGRAAAFLYVLLGAGEIYAGVMSDTAAAVLERFGVAASWDSRIPTVLNRDLTGLCPMESAVLEINEPAAALAAIKARAAALAGK